MTIDVPEGYESLGLALGEAVAQASRGKGAERHAESGEKFSDQLIMSIPKRLGPGGECFCLGQALKKICESRRLPPDRARAELLGAVNYLAAAWCLLGGTEAPKAPGNVCLDFAERVVSLMKEAGVREVSFASPGACIRDDGTVTGLHFTTGDADSPAAPEDGSFVSPLFAEGERVKYAVDGKWESGAYVGVDPDGKHVVSTGSSYVHLDESLVRKA